MTRPHYILVVDDDQDVRESMADILRDEGYPTEVASDGREAMDRLLRNDELPSLIILDLMMPRMNGWELAEVLKSSTRTAKIPLIVVSASSEEPPPGVTVLRKPLRTEDLLELVHEKSTPTTMP